MKVPKITICASKNIIMEAMDLIPYRIFQNHKDQCFYHHVLLKTMCLLTGEGLLGY